MVIQPDKEDKEHRAKWMSLFMRMLAVWEECLEFDPAMIVEKVVVSENNRLNFVLNDGMEHTVDGVR